ncbi:DMT family transporter [Paraferrimonas haliotis]|uniref:Membrane protein n=1 Tax=Paraferrimonas haliotis TaxID=2013866 RepID=A0AA37TNF3_9GAMM|nr:DMT family transporter [Paraferrimonas haliotis]GLS83653.1 membrane protein [Paraferrimonas haliotis]
MQAHWKPYGYGLLAVLFWSTVATAFKIALTQVTPIQLVLLASLASMLFLAGLLSYQKQWRLVGRQLNNQPAHYLKTGLLNPFLYYLVLFEAYALLPAQQAQSLNYTWPVVLSLLMVPLLGQKLTKVDIVAAIIAYLGVLIIATGGNILAMEFESGLGVFLALLSTVLWALYWVFNTKDKGEPIVSLFISFCISLPFILAATLLTDGLPSMTYKALFAAVYVGLFEMGITFVLWLKALKLASASNQVSTASVSNLAFLSPVLSLFFISAILEEHIRAATYVGLGCIITALMLQRLVKLKP